MSRTILVVDDEPAILVLIRHNLEHEGFRVLTAEDGATALSVVTDQHPDLIVLDLMLPGIPGLEVLRQIRALSVVPVIVLTARKEEVDRVVGLEMGADDYVTKPFSVRELIARIKAMFRRQDLGAATPEIVLHGLSVNMENRIVHIEGRSVNLTTTEFEILALLAQHPGRVFSRQELLRQVWGYGDLGDTRTVNVHIKNLREKLGEAQSLVETVRGIGYRIRAVG
jgi:DNA-binding response OmpR family regulator